MQAHSTVSAPLSTIPIVNGVACLRGYGVRVSVAGAHLICQDGICDERREARFHRATSGLKRLAILSTDGYLSLSAVEYLHQMKASLIQIDGSGAVLLASAPAGCDYPHLRRAQALAAFTDVGLSITRTLLGAKLQGQADVLATAGHKAEAERVATLSAALADVDGLDELRLIEGQAASVYWQAMEDSPVRFARKDQKRVPAHWLTLGSRGSAIANGPRNATNPANAMLNYLYAILEAETRIAILTQGLDPGIGILHTDQPSSDAMVYDLMEAARPVADRLLLDLLSAQVFTRADFGEWSTGEVRLSAALRERLTALAPQIAQAIAPHVEQLARTLAETAPGPSTRLQTRAGQTATLPTVLTQKNRSNGRALYRVHETRAQSATSGPSLGQRPSVQVPRCRDCGAELASDREYCDACLSTVRAEGAATITKAGPAALAEMRDRGEDPAHGGDAGAKRGSTQRERIDARAAWERSHGSPEAREALMVRFATETRARLQNVSLNRMREATGLSLRYCSLIRSGEQEPHPMYVEALEALAESTLERGEGSAQLVAS